MMRLSLPSLKKQIRCSLETNPCNVQKGVFTESLTLPQNEDKAALSNHTLGVCVTHESKGSRAKQTGVNKCWVFKKLIKAT
jgi:hypothetical protein